jgi:hypothetical protein
VSKITVQGPRFVDLMEDAVVESWQVLETAHRRLGAGLAHHDAAAVRKIK